MRVIFIASPAQARFFAGLFTNLTAGWIGAIVVTSSFKVTLSILTYYLFFAIVCGWIAIRFEEITER